MQALAMMSVPPMPEEIASFPRNVVHDMIERLIEQLDDRDPDPDLEQDDPTENNGDDVGDMAWVEWTTMRGSQKAGPNIIVGFNEDIEDDEGGGDTSGDEGEPNFNPDKRFPTRLYGPGCEISDSDYGGEEAGEPEHY